MHQSLPKNWKSKLSSEFQKEYFTKLTQFVKAEYRQQTCYPNEAAVFSAFNRCPFDSTKVVIIGQDPYHGPEQANGLCFSVGDAVQIPPSLNNIFKEIVADLGVSYPENGTLERWADQGVLLLNATLTVRTHQPGSHQKMGWEQFTDAVIQKLSSEREGIVFLLWGGFAKKKVKLIDSTKHHVLTSGHPSPLSANRGYWFGNKHFSKTNALLMQQNLLPIDW